MSSPIIKFRDLQNRINCHFERTDYVKTDEIAVIPNGAKRNEESIYFIKSIT